MTDTAGTVGDARAPRPDGLLAAVDPALAATVQEALVAVEQRMHAAVGSHDTFVAETARYLVEAGGKRFRPMMVVLSALAVRGPTAPLPEPVLDVAVAVELTHLATLYHDDVMDEAELRRGAPAANRRWSNSVAILTGDFLFARASEIAAGLGPDAVRLLARTLATLCEGQLRETQGPGPGTDPVGHYLRVVEDKTASLIAAGCRLGATAAGGDEVLAARLEDYGQAVGVAFQIADDILDIASESVQSGKQPGTDLREGILTLPVLYALAGDDAAGELRALLARDLATDETSVQAALRLLRGSPAMARARGTLARYTADAREAATSVADGVVGEALVAAAAYVSARTG